MPPRDAGRIARHLESHRKQPVPLQERGGVGGQEGAQGCRRASTSSARLTSSQPRTGVPVLYRRRTAAKLAVRASRDRPALWRRLHVQRDSSHTPRGTFVKGSRPGGWSTRGYLVTSSRRCRPRWRSPSRRLGAAPVRLRHYGSSIRRREIDPPSAWRTTHRGNPYRSAGHAYVLMCTSRSATAAILAGLHSSGTPASHDRVKPTLNIQIKERRIPDGSVVAAGRLGNARCAHQMKF